MKKFCLAMIHWYQKHLSPFIGRDCRFTPSCSHYAEEAIVRFGVVRGCFLAAKRLLRCNPFGGYGVDPVPETWEQAKRKSRFARKN